MLDSTALYQIAEDSKIPILTLALPQTSSMCIQTKENQCYIGMDYAAAKDETSCKIHLAHELGHCMTGAFYNRYTPLDIRQKHENRADKWAVLACITADELDDAVADGCENIWELAEHFGVTEDFMYKAVCWYVHGNLAADLYF